MNIQKFKFDNVEIEFDLRQGKNMMVNATEMAKCFNKDVFQFTRIDDTKNFLKSCLKPQFCGLLGVKSEDDLIVSKQKSGTWMHRVLALKFAAWLNSDFEVWTYSTIDQIIFGTYIEIDDSISESVLLEKRKKDLMKKLGKENADFNEILNINQQLQNSKNRRRLATISKFREKNTDLFSGAEAEN